MSKKIIIIFLMLMFGAINFSYADMNYNATNSDAELLKFGITFTPPVGWQKVKLQNVPDAIYYTNPDRKANISIGLPKQVPSASFELSINMLRMAKKPISEEKIVFLDAPCYVFIFQQVNNSGVKIKTKGYQFFKNGKAYSITYSADEVFFNSYFSEFEKALNEYGILE